MIKLIVCVFASFALALLTGKILIPVLKRARVGQPILSYVTEHKDKQGTPTMGGWIFVLPCVVSYLAVFKAGSSHAVFGCAVLILFAFIGFADDFIKVRYNKNEGLRPWQKTAFLFAASIVASVYLYRQGATIAYIPFTKTRINAGLWFLPLSVFVFLSTANCVNLTDGLDGLAGSTALVYFMFNAALVFLQTGTMAGNYLFKEQTYKVAALCLSLSAALGGFLVYNVNKASVFMGDTGSLALGGLAAYAMEVTGNVFYIPLLGGAFVFSGVSVILQVLHYKRTRRRIFLMAPAHHHFQHKGYGESKIVFCYVCATAALGLICALAYVGSINVL